MEKGFVVCSVMAHAMTMYFFLLLGDSYLSVMMVANKNVEEGMMRLQRGKKMVSASRKKGSQQTAKGVGKLKLPGDVLKV